jgi:hypothetical protein
VALAAKCGSGAIVLLEQDDPPHQNNKHHTWIQVDGSF